MRAKPTKTFRIDADLADRVEALAMLLDPHPSANAVVEACVRQMLLLIDSPSPQRTLPDLVRQVDTLRAQPPALPSAVSVRPR